MTPAEVERIIDRACRQKRAYPDKGAAAKAAAAMNRRRHARFGVDAVVAYRCPFCCDAHVGRPPSIGRMHQLADAMRELAAA